MKQNEDTFPIEVMCICVILIFKTERGTKTVSLVDIPGHSRVRNLFADYIPVGIGVIYVVDAVDFDNQIRTVAEYLVDVVNLTFSDIYLTSSPTRHSTSEEFRCKLPATKVTC